MSNYGRTQLIDAWLPGFLSTTRTQAWTCSNKVSAGFTKNTLVKPQLKSEAATGPLRPPHNLIGSASGKTLIRCRLGNGKKRSVQRRNRSLPFGLRAVQQFIFREDSADRQFGH